MRENFLKLQKREATISTFVRPSLVTEINSGLDPLLFEERIVNKSVMFVDIVGYTQMSEVQSNQDMFLLLNEYFDVISKTVFANSGEVDKYIGDAVMAIFDSPNNCLASCLEIQKRFSSLQETRLQRGSFSYSIGIGISHGPVLLGNFGSNEKMDRTVIGDSVNIASRIEHLTRVYGVSAIATDDFIESLGEHDTAVRVIAETNIRGRKSPANSTKYLETTLPQFRQKKSPREMH